MDAEDEKVMRRHLIDMFNTRKWSVSERPPPLFPAENTLFSGTTDQGKNFVCLRFDSFGVKPTERIIQYSFTIGIEHLVLVLGKLARAPAQLKLKEKNIDFEMFIYSELMYNPMNHPLQPTFLPLDSKQKAQFMDHYGLKDSSIAKFVRKDMVVRYHFWPPGTLVKIVFPSSVSYRLVQ